MDMKIIHADDPTKRALQITIPVSDETYIKSAPSKNSGKEGKEVQHLLAGTSGFMGIAGLPGTPKISLNMIVPAAFVEKEYGAQAVAAATQAAKAKAKPKAKTE